MKRRFVFLHYHLFKNAGTTIDWILQRNFRHAFASLHEVTSTGVIVNEEILSFLAENPYVEALTSHHIRLPPPRHEHFRCIEICFLRHPLDRLQSIYYYYRRLADTADPNVAQAHRLGLPDFLVWFCETQPFLAINPQTAYLGNGGAFFFPPSPKHLERAVSCLEEIRFLGVVERFDDSLLVAEYFLRTMFPNLDLSYLPQQVNPHRPVSLEARVEELEKACGPALFADLKRANELDVELVAAAERELDRRLQFIPNLAARREEFRLRCQRLAATNPAEIDLTGI